jgi:hypothetical protein
MSYSSNTRVLLEEFEFNGLKIKLYNEDLQHALDNHPGEVTQAEIGACIENPDKVIQSLVGVNGCLFYQKRIIDEYFVVVVHTTGSGTGDVKTAYKATYVKKGTVLFDKEKK